MSSTFQATRSEEVTDLVLLCQRQGIRLWTENGRLRYRAPKEVLSRELLESLRGASSHIVEFLDGVASAETLEPKILPRERPDRAPLTFTQLAYWHSYRLAERRVWRGVTAFVRLKGLIDLDRFRLCVSSIVARHEALRTMIVTPNGIPTLQIGAGSHCELRIDDLTGLSGHLQDLEANRLIEEFLGKSIDVRSDPLSGIQLIRLHDTDHMLVVAMQHIVSDGFSVRILLRDLLSRDLRQANPDDPGLPEIPIQFSDYATWLRSLDHIWINQRGVYWKQRLKGLRRLQLSNSETSPEITQLGCMRVPIHIDGDTTSRLREWCRSRTTTLVMGVLTAYVALVLRWCRASEGMVLFQSDGRHSQKTHNTLGYFATQLYLKVETHEDVTFTELLKLVTESYCLGHQYADSSYLQAHTLRPDISRHSLFNWLPRGPASTLPTSTQESALTWTEFEKEHPSLKYLEPENELALLFKESDTEINGHIVAPRSRFSPETVEEIQRALQRYIHSLLSDPDIAVPKLAPG